MIDLSRIANALAIVLLPSALAAQEVEGVDSRTPSQQFEQIRSWEGRWEVAETPSLTIEFETFARGSAMVERWETQAGLHSMTVYHMEDDALIATHYCPQGNQPRLQSKTSSVGEIRFSFRDVTDLDPGESHAHELWFTPAAEGTLQRSEVYRGEEGLQPATHYTLNRAR
jgi:hypothetical protein